MITSRPLPHIERYLSSFQRLDIRAKETDIRNYVNDRIKDEVELADFVNEDDTLLGKNVDKLVQRCNGM